MKWVFVCCLHGHLHIPHLTYIIPFISGQVRSLIIILILKRPSQVAADSQVKMSQRKARVIFFCENVFNGNDRRYDELLNHIKFRFNIKELKLTKETYHEEIEKIGDDLFSNRPATLPYVLVLMKFGLELNIHLTSTASWFSEKLLVETISKILLKTTFDPKRLKSEQSIFLQKLIMGFFSLKVLITAGACFISLLYFRFDRSL